jgi:hypothetical protein
MEDVRIQGWYTSPPSSRTPYFMDKDVLDMTLIERMVAAGMSRDCAAETAMWYMAQGDDEGLEDYVASLEAKYGIHTAQ